MKKFAFVLMGPTYDPAIHRAEFVVGTRLTRFQTVRNYEEAKRIVKGLADEGFGVIEVCGAFGPDKTKELIELTGHRVGIGYVVHHPEQDEIFNTFFAK